MIISVFIILNILIFFSCSLLAFVSATENRISRILLTAMVYMSGQITISVLFSGVILNHLEPRFLILGNLLLSVMVIYHYRKWVQPLLRKFFHDLSESSREILNSKNPLLYLLILLFTAQALIILIKIYYLPPHVWDVYTYHLHPMAEWLQQGRIPSLIDTPVIRANTNPLGAHIFHYWMVALLGDLTWIEIPQFFGGMLLALSVYVLLTFLKIPRLQALIYAITAYFTPISLIQSRTCQDHLLLAAYICSAAVFFIGVFIYERSFFILPLGMVLGLIIGIKQNSPLILAMFFLALFIAKGFALRQLLKALKDFPRLWLTGLLLMLMTGSYWFFREGVLVKKYIEMARSHGARLLLPFLSLLLLIFFYTHIKKRFFRKNMSRSIKIGMALLLCCGLITLLGVYFHRGGLIPLLKPAFLATSPIPAHQLQPYGSLVKNLLSAPGRIKDTGAPFSPDNDNISGFGPVFMVLGVPAFLLIPIWLFGGKRSSPPGGDSEDERGKIILRFLFLLPLLIVFNTFLYYSSRFSYRMYIFWPAFGVILWAALVQRINFSRGILRLLEIVLAAIVLFSGITSFWEGESRPQQWKSLFTMNEPSSRTMTEFSSLLDAPDFHFLSDCASSDEPVAFTGGVDTWIFPLYDHHLRRRLIFLNTLDGFAVGSEPGNPYGARILDFSPKLRDNLRKRGVRLIYLPRQGCNSWEIVKFRENERDIIQITENLFYFQF